MKMARQIGWWLLMLIVTGALISAGNSADTQEDRGQWSVALGEEADTLDPPATVQFTSDIFIYSIFDALVGLEGEALKPVGLLAERWQSLNPTTWRFNLRKGVKFHNGEEFDASDVKYSFDIYLDAKARRSTYAKGIERVEVRDPFTVDIITAQPFAPILTNLSRLVILPKDTREKMGLDQFARAPVGTGPYAFGEWRRDEKLVLAANQQYWRGAPTPARLTFRIVKDPTTRVAELRTGGVDIIANPPVPQLEALSKGETAVTAVKGGRIIFYAFQLKQAPFDNRKVREAANLAVNRTAIVESVLGGHGVVLAGPFSSATLGFDARVKPHPYDPARARQLLAEAGYPSGFDTTWSVSSGAFLKDKEIAEAVAGQLRQVGIRVQLIPTERAKLQQDFQSGTFQGITSGAWGVQYEPDPMLGWIYRPYFPLPTIHKLVEQGRGEVDPAKRTGIYQEIYRTAHDDALWLYVHAQDELWAKRRDIRWLPYSITGSKALTYYFYFKVPGGG